MFQRELLKFYDLLHLQQMIQFFQDPFTTPKKGMFK
jgi:hypothetical protein